MMCGLRRLVLVLVLGVAGAELREDFEVFVSSLPRSLLQQQVAMQSSVLDLLQAYRSSKDELFPYEHFHPNEHYGDYGEYHSLEAEVNVGVVFMGFPDNSIPRIRDLFFNDLERRDHLHVFDQREKRSHAIPSPGSAVINHQFHVVDTSFHADEVIRRFMRLLLRPQHEIGIGSTPSVTSNRGKYYINVWEIEAALESLNWHMQHHLNEDNKHKKKRPSLTMYVLNLDLDLDMDVNIDTDLNINPELDVDKKKFVSHSHKHSYTYKNGFSQRDLDLIRRNSTCLKLAKSILAEKEQTYDVSRKIFERSQESYIASLHREYNSVEELEASLTPPPEPDNNIDDAWNEYYSDYGSNKEEESSVSDIEEHFRLNEVHASKSWARGWSDDFIRNPDAMILEARVIRILKTTDPLSPFYTYKFDLARDLVLGMPENMDNGSEDVDNPGISWVGSKSTAWLDLTAKAQTPDSSVVDLDNLLNLGEVLNYEAMSSVNSEESRGRRDGAVFGADSGAPYSTDLSHKPELYALRHSLHQHHIHCGRVLLHTRRREIEHGLTSSDETLAHEDILYRLGTLPALEAGGSISPSYLRNVNAKDTKQLMESFELVRSSIKEGIEAGHLSKFSAILYLQQSLISYSLELSVLLELAEVELVATVDSGEASHEYYVELMEYHNMVLAEIIEMSNMFIGKGHFSRKGFASKAIHDALATVGSAVLDLTRSLLSKPVTMMPHLPQLEVHLATQEDLKRKIKLDVQAELTSHMKTEKKKDAFSMLKSLKDDALSTAIFRGIEQTHQEVLLSQAHFDRAGDVGRFGGYGRYRGYDDDFGRYGSHFGNTFHDESSSSKKNAEVLLTTIAMTPPLLVPKNIEIEIYVVKMQNSYLPLVEKERKGANFVNSIQFDSRASFFGNEHGNDHSLGFDMKTFMSEVQRLKLSNQQMSVTVHTIESKEESSLYLGLAGCRRYRTNVDSEVTSSHPGLSQDDIFNNVSYYYSAQCVWRHLQHTDDINQRHLDVESGQDLPESQHVAMFILSVDSLSPHYLDSNDDDMLHQAVTFGDSILLMQNKQISIPCTHASSVNQHATSNLISSSSSTNRFLGRVSTSWNGRNPLQAALDATSRLILGMGGMTTQIHKRCHSKTHLSPLHVSSFHYSDIELAAAFRNRILRSVDFGEALEDITSRDISAVGHEYIPELYAYLNSFTLKAIKELDNLCWERAAVISNMIVKIAWKKRRHFDAFVHRQRISGNSKKSFDVLNAADSRFGEYGGYMDDDYRMYHAMYNHDEDVNDANGDDLADKSIVGIIFFLACKTLFVTGISGGLSYIFYFSLARLINNIFYNKSQSL